jgi:hydrogenase maturation protease
MSGKGKILIYGYGNPGRQDDGAGIMFAEALQKNEKLNELFDFEFDGNYQLNIEDADRIKDFDLVLFADATVEDIEDYYFSKVNGSKELTFTTHAANPAYILELCRNMFGKEPETLLLHIKGYEWELEEVMSERTKKHLDKAFRKALEIFRSSRSTSEISEKLLMHSN